MMFTWGSDPDGQMRLSLYETPAGRLLFSIKAPRSAWWVAPHKGGYAVTVDETLINLSDEEGEAFRKALVGLG